MIVWIPIRLIPWLVLGESSVWWLATGSARTARCASWSSCSGYVAYPSRRWLLPLDHRHIYPHLNQEHRDYRDWL